MDQAVFKESLLKKRAEILSEGGAKLRASMTNPTRVSDIPTTNMAMVMCHLGMDKEEEPPAEVD